MSQFPSTTSASDVWDVTDVYRAVAGGNWPPNYVSDPYFPYVTMLLPGNGTNATQNNTFLDSSNTPNTITRAGNTTQGTYSPYGPNWGTYFNGSSDFLTWTGANCNGGTWTLEAWVFPTANGGGSYGGRGIISCGDVFLNMGFDSANKITLRWYTGSTGYSISSTTVLSLNTWYYVAVTWQAGTSAKVFVNGVLENSTTSNLTIASSTSWQIGREGAQASYFPGYISNARVSSAILYSSTFTPSTTPLTASSDTNTLTCKSNRFVDTSTNAYALTVNGAPIVQRFSPFSPNGVYSTSTIGGSGYFDGSGDYLSVADNSALDLSTGDFTIECWAYPLTGISDLDGLISKRNQSTFSGSDWRIAYKTASTAFGIATGSNTTDRLTPAIKLNCWNHIAFVRSSGTLKCYANGVLGDSLAWTENLDNAESLLVGLNVAGYDFPGYITDVRINKGTAIYTGAFTPPTLAPLATSGASSAACYPSTTNVNTSFAASTTSLLTSMTNAAIIDNAEMNDFETVGSVQISTAQSKFGGSSVYLPGVGNYLVSPASPSNALGTGDFTVEAWVYPSGNQTRFGNIVSGVGAWYLSFEASNYLFFSDPSTVFVQSSTPLSTNTWTYVAVTRSGTTLKMFFNGSEVASATNSTNFGSTPLQARLGYNGASHYFVGYLNDVRVTKGVARTITTPTSAFPTR